MTTPISNSDLSTELYLASVQKAAARQLTIAELFSSARALATSGKCQMAAELYKIWICYNSDADFLHAVYFNYGMALVEAGDRYGAINALRDCIRLNPDFHAAYVNLGRVLEDSGQAGPAVAQWVNLINPKVHTPLK